MKAKVTVWGITSWSFLAFFLLLITASAFAETEEKEDLQKRDSWFVQHRLQGLEGRNPAALLLKARQKAKTMPKAVGPAREILTGAKAAPKIVASNFTFGTWNAAGPQKLDATGIEQNLNAVFSGRGTALAVDLNDDKTGNTVYYGAADGGVWKSTDALTGGDFTPISDQTESLAVGCIALDTSGSIPSVYVGTGEANGVGSYYGIGILKSTDGGNSWNPPITSATGVSGTIDFAGMSFSKIIVDPSNPQTVLAATVPGAFLAGHDHPTLMSSPPQSSFGVFRSTDRGATWTQVPTLAGQTVNDMIWSPGNNAYFAAVSGQGFYISNDHGATWVPTNSPFYGNLPVDPTNFGRASLACRGVTLYGLIEAAPDGDPQLSAPSANDTGIVQTVNGGVNWTAIATPNPLTAGQPWTNQLNYNQYIAVPPDPTSTSLIVGGIFDQMTNQVNGMSTQWVTLGSAHSDQHAIAFYNNTSFYAANDGGLFYTSTLGSTFTELNDTLNTIQLYSVSPDSSNAGVLIGGAQDNGVETTTGKLSWTQIGGGDGFYTAADPNNPGQYFAEIFNGLYQFSQTGQGSLINYSMWVPFEVMPQSNPVSLVAAPNDIEIGPGHSTNPDVDWHSISPKFGFDAVNGLAPVDGNTIYLTAGSNVNYTTNASSASPTWSALDPTGLSLGLGHIAVGSWDPNTVYVVVEGFVDGQKIYKGTGVSSGNPVWTNISGTLPNMPINWITLDDQNPGTLYLATDVGVFMATDGGVSGENWQVVGTGLPNASVLQVKISDLTRQLLVATFGRGAWTLDIGGNLNANRPPTPTPTFVCVPTGGTWNPDTSTAQFNPRTAFGSTVFKGQMWVAGGRTGNGVPGGHDNNDVWFSTDGKTWDPAGIQNFAAREQFGLLDFDPGDGLGERLWVIGGYNPLSSPVSYYNDVWYSFNGFNWSLATTHANFSGRGGFASVVFNNRMWVIGGGGYDDVWSSPDGIHWLKEADNVGFLSQGGAVAAAVLNNQLFLMAGGSSPTKPNATWSSFDGVNWNSLTTNTGFTPRSNFAGLSLGGQLWIIGGAQGTARFNDLWSSPDGKSWKQAPGVIPFSGRTNGGDLVFQNQLWVIGGNAQILQSDVWNTTCNPGPPPPVPTSTPVCASPVTAGYSSIGSVIGHYGNDRMYANAITLSGPVSAESLSLYVDNATYSGSTPPHQFMLSIYKDNGNNYPGDLVLQTGVQQAISNGWNTVGLPWNDLPAGVYWLAAQADDGDGGLPIASDNGGGAWAYVSSGVPFGTAPAVFPVGTSGTNQQTSLYLNACSSTGGTGAFPVGAGLIGEVLNQLIHLIGIQFSLSNTGSTAIHLGQVEVRYWFNSDCPGDPLIRAWVQGKKSGDLEDQRTSDLIQTGSGILSPRSSIHYLSFNFNGGNLPVGSTINIGAEADFAGDLFHGCEISPTTSGTRLTVYVNGHLVSGQVPGTPPTLTATPTISPTPTMMGRVTSTPTCPFTLSSAFICGTATPISGILNAGMEKEKANTPSFTPTPTPTLTPTMTPILTRELMRSVVAAPNISNGDGPINFLIELHQPAQVTLSLYSLTGEEVYSTRLEGNQGMNQLEWALENNAHQPVASGLYVYLLQVDNGTTQERRLGKVVIRR